MLETLDQIPWRNYHDAYGPSAGTPGNLRMLASNDPKKRAKGLDELAYTIYHQGTVYEATVHAVPFLLEMLAEPTYTGKTDVLELLRWISEGTSYHDVHQHLTFKKDKAESLQYQERVRTEKGWVAQIAAEIRKGTNLLVALLKDPDPDIRIGVTELLVRLKDVRAQARASLLDQMRSDPDPSVRAAALATIAVVDPQDSETRDVLRQAFSAETDATCRATIAIMLVGIEHAQAGPAMINLCREIAAGDTDQLGKPNEILGPWSQAATISLAGWYMAPDDILERIIMKLDSGGMSEQHAIAVLMLALGERRGPWISDELLPIQRHAIMAVARRAFPERSTIYINLADVLKVFNLPQDRGAMEKLLREKLPIRQRGPNDDRKPWWKFW